MNIRSKRILITRPRGQAAGFAASLRQTGALPLIFPTIEIVPTEDNPELDQALKNLSHFDWLILTSANGVHSVWKRMRDLHMPDVPLPVKIAAIGPKTATAIREHGWQVDFVPDAYVAEAILPGLGELAGRRFLLLRAAIARPALAESIRAGGGEAHEIPVYHTIQGMPDEDEWAAFRAGVDVVTFTSSSTVRYFATMVREKKFDLHSLPGKPLIACIGPITAQTARELGLEVTVQAKTYTTQGLIDALQAFPESVPNERLQITNQSRKQ